MWALLRRMRSELRSWVCRLNIVWCRYSVTWLGCLRRLTPRTWHQRGQNLTFRSHVIILGHQPPKSACFVMLASVPVSPGCAESFCDLTEQQLGVRVLFQALVSLEMKCRCEPWVWARSWKQSGTPAEWWRVQNYLWRDMGCHTRAIEEVAARLKLEKGLESAISEFPEEPKETGSEAWRWNQGMDIALVKPQGRRWPPK